LILTDLFTISLNFDKISLKKLQNELKRAPKLVKFAEIDLRIDKIDWIRLQNDQTKDH
jgi:hypothetical protein